ncbi:hypothetical protein FOCC_FOCC002498 [Frankliniella occidentalis]|nr:hypothetical protein FOCC_FOCC002498 [Frankliniella occidentalis]
MSSSTGTSRLPILSRKVSLLCIFNTQSSPHRIVYGSWLLVSVVISSAYQGQLRTQLSVGKMKGEIDTLEELAESNLSILMGIELRPSASSLLPARMLPRVEYVNEFEQLLPMLHYVAEQRNVALIIFDDFDPWILTSGAGLSPNELKKALV